MLHTGFAGPVGLASGVRLVVDLAARGLAGFGCGANREDAHFGVGALGARRRAVAVG